MNATAGARLNILFVESYVFGSHGRVLELVMQHSRHNVDFVAADRGHWTWLAMTSHFDLADQVRARCALTMPDVLVFSGEMSVGTLLAMLPVEVQRLPRIAYFHESQWSYPNRPDDPRAYWMQHLDAIALCDEAWFNSRFHLGDFWETATSPAVNSRIRRIAQHLMSERYQASRVVYPPVEIAKKRLSPRSHDRTSSLVWNARWEHDKRPDMFIHLLDRLKANGLEPNVTVLGTGGVLPDQIRRDLGRYADRATIPGHLDQRDDYENTIDGKGVLVSTAEHEFFGIAAIESVLAGNAPVLPLALAYPETLPSAWFYRPGDLGDLVRTVAAAMANAGGTQAMHRSDAERFSADSIVPLWDANFTRLARGQIARP